MWGNNHLSTTKNREENQEKETKGWRTAFWLKTSEPDDPISSKQVEKKSMRKFKLISPPPGRLISEAFQLSDVVQVVGNYSSKKPATSSKWRSGSWTTTPWVAPNESDPKWPFSMGDKSLLKWPRTIIRNDNKISQTKSTLLQETGLSATRLNTSLCRVPIVRCLRLQLYYTYRNFWYLL